MSVPLNPLPRANMTDGRGTLLAPWQAWFTQLYTYVTKGAAGGGGLVPFSRTIGTTAPLAGGGDLSADLTLTVAFNGITNAYLAQMPAATLKGNNTAGPANALDLNAAQVTAMLNIFTPLLKGLVPASAGGTTTYLRADGAFASPGANPSAAVGLAAINGVAATFMRSDAAPPLDVSIAPTWTGVHTFGAGAVATSVALTAAAPTVAAGEVSFGNGVATTASTTGGGSALPALALGYLIVNVNGTPGKVPFYAN